MLRKKLSWCEIALRIAVARSGSVLSISTHLKVLNGIRTLADWRMSLTLKIRKENC